MRTISDALLAKQSTSGIPHIQAVFTSRDGGTTYDYSTDIVRMLQLEHTEEPYSSSATIILNNSDRLVPDLTGYFVDLAYGYHTGNAVAEPNGDNSTHEYSYTPRLWVKHQLEYSAEGQLKVILQLEGVWEILQEQLLAIGNPPYYQDENNVLVAMTVYGVIERIIETELTTASGFTFTLTALANSDGIIDSYVPAPEINSQPFDTMAEVIQVLMDMTKEYIRAKASLAFEIVYPKSTDNPNENYYSNQVHFFVEYTESRNLLIPNHVVLFANQDEDGTWPNLITAERYSEDDFNVTTYDGRYMEVKRYYIAAAIRTQVDADNRADAILTKAFAEVLSARCVIPHDSRVEIYDRVAVFDVRGT